MAHELEFVNGQAAMSYAGEVPWHGLGKRVPSDLTPLQMLESFGGDWTVDKSPAVTLVNGVYVETGHSALVRSSDHRIMDVVTDDWVPMQNIDAFEFFNDFVEAGEMEMHTAGSLKDGRIIWALAKVGEEFDLFGGDKIESYLLFTNPHSYGQSIDVRFTPVRVVCNNTLTLSLNTASKRMAKVSHRKAFDADMVKETLGIAKHKLSTYKEMASFLGSKQASDENVVEYFKRVFPVLTAKEASTKDISKSAAKALEILHTQPGAQYAEGTFWQTFNAVTYMTDHIIGRSVDNRLTSAWYGANKGLKTKALEIAVEMAEAV
jgi:phage/plasmid-like protein (TIGR03299 family)